MGLADKILNAGRSNPVEQLGKLSLWQKILKKQPQDVLTDTAKQRLQEPYPFAKRMGVQGTNYDPYDPSQTRPSPDGRGAVGELMEESMVATSHKADKITGNMRLGTVFYIPELDKKYLVADVMNERFAGESRIDFVTPKQGKKIFEKYNKPFTVQILREGKGYEDARNFIKSGEREKMK